MNSQELKEKKLKVVLLKGGLKYLEEIRDTVEERMESIESKINELMGEIRQDEGESE